MPLIKRSFTLCCKIASLSLGTLVLALYAGAASAQTAAPPSAAAQTAGAKTAAASGATATTPQVRTDYVRLPDSTMYAATQAAPHAAPPENAGKSEGAGEGTHEGIKVHGHWIIDVRNPDGTLAEHRDFENSLVGSNDVLGFLYGSEVPSDYAVYFTGTPSACAPPGGTSYDCDIVHNLSVLPANVRCSGNGDYCVTGLTITPTFGSNPSLVMAGSLTATQSGNVTTVGTFIGICGSPTTTLTTVSASSCAAGNSGYGYGALTQASITSVPIMFGQIIQITVTITFS